MSVELVGHRGCGHEHPENTVRAFVETARRLDAVEFDVRRCGSGEPVVVHDERLDRIAGVDARVDETPWPVVRELDVLGTDEPIPRLADVLDAVPAGTTLQVELKTVGVADDVAAALADADRPARVTSFSPAALAAFAEAEGSEGVPTGLLFSGDPEANLSLAARLDCGNVHPHVDDCLRTGVVGAARDRGFGAYAWGAGSPADVDAAADAGVDGLTVDAARWGDP
ncbi:glycerophosphodiester phosphodiesterase [Candidatus Halobonum tyrrellensis]|uniref:Glycerophosphoryl diester phosphodiesterase n=1 Tax=Candidatus Halobonum tyrrellensis G22 TaxID=1324957 RepID=V4IZX9_9EURY|nr:glycerophosphodiester phosphodiesterase [Candidatus Halobonum tyrrellensis]ESP88717.1 glycerophosphoryl diester phosphodiesterase [Candidatus Halobonum tyrrellensis G22]